MYYALYQAVVAEMEERKLRPEDVDPVAKASKLAKDPTEPGGAERWRHRFLASFTTLGRHLQLDRRDAETFMVVQEMRVRADYTTKAIRSDELTKIEPDAKALLNSLGVNV